MYRWCSYCRDFQGEITPHQKNELVFGICRACQDENVIKSPHSTLGARRMRELFIDVQRRAMRGQSISWKDLGNEARELSINTSDFLMGFLQPLLKQLGDLFERGKISSDPVESFALGCESFADGILATSTVSPSGELVLVSGGAHRIGMKFISVLLLEKGIAPVLVTQAANPQAVLRQPPKILGISVTTEQDAEFAASCGRAIESLNAGSRPRLAIGGAYAGEARGIPVSFRFRSSHADHFIDFALENLGSNQTLKAA